MSRYHATIVDEDGRPVPLPPGVTPAEGSGRGRDVARSKALVRFRNATGFSQADVQRLGFCIRITSEPAAAQPAPEVAASE